MIKYYKIIKKFFKLGVNNKKYLFLLILTAILRMTLQLIPPIFVAKIIDTASIGDFDSSFNYLVCLAFSYFIYNIAHHFNFVAYAHNAHYIFINMRKKIFEKTMDYNVDYNKKISKAFLLNTMSKDVGSLGIFPDVVFDGIASLIGVVGAIGILCFNNILLGMCAISVMIIYIWLLGDLDRKKSHYMYIQRKKQDYITGLISQTLEGEKEVKQFEMNQELNKYMDKGLKEWNDSYFLKRKYWDRRDVLAPLIITALKIFTYLVVVYLIVSGETTIGVLVLMTSYLDKIEDYVEEFSANTNEISRCFDKVERVYEVLTFKSSKMLEFGNYNKDDINGIIEYKNVDFKYDSKQILTDISFKIMPNKLTAIVGKSGCGKSTIFRTLLRLYDIDSGEILIDGINIKEFSKEVFPNNVGVVTQKPFMFNMSIKDNLSLVNNNREKQIEACKIVGMHNFIMSLPSGYNTIIKENAKNISGGQLQLLSLARNILSGAEILLFDEVTSSLDPNTAKKVSKILKKLKRNHTVIMITHKPSLMKQADEIIVLDKGKIVGIGTHKKLLKENEFYKILQ